MRFEKILYSILVALALSIVIIPKFYITGDGAAHTYNAKVLFDIVRGEERTFYESFYIVNRHLDPNWSSHLILGILLQFLPYWLADKMFQILYILVFVSGLRYLIRSINKENSFLSFLFFPFLFNLPFQQGFYNYCLAVGLLFFCYGFYIRNRKKLEDPLKASWLALLILATTFSHGMPALYAMLLIFIDWAYHHFYKIRTFQFSFILPQISRFFLIFLPSLLLIFLFLIKRGSGIIAHSWGIGKKLAELFKMWTSQSTRNAELYPAMATLLFIFIYLLICFIRNRSGKGYSTHKTGVKRPVLFLFTLFLFLSYLNCPHSIGGAGSIDIRLGYLLPLFLLIALSASQWKNMEKKIFIAVSFLITIGYLGIRFPYVMRASAIGKEIMTAGPYIRDKGVVLNLHYDDNQSLPGNDTLFQKDNSFLHFSEFLGAEKNKHLIMVMNYEAEISYFPVNWNFNKNPRLSIEKMIQNNYPPCGKVHRYENQIGQNVDYVLFQNWKKEFEKETCTANLLREMDSLGFYKKYESPKQAIIVYERRM